MRILTPLFALLLFLPACSTHQTSLEYDPSRAKGLRGEGRKNVAVGIFKDERDLPDTYLGQIREAGGPIQKKIETSVPIAQIVGNTFGYGLKVRDMLNDRGADYRLFGVVREFSCDQILRAGASAEVTVQLSRAGSDRAIFSKTYTAENTAVTPNVGVLGDPQFLKDLASRTLQQVVDKALDDPELRTLTDAD